jgi:hypothetical protein
VTAWIAQRLSALSLIEAARSHSVQISVDGNDLVLAAAVAPPTDVLVALSHQKAEIISLLRRSHPSWSAEDWLVQFDERAGVLEFDGGQIRQMAELLAIGECVLDFATSKANDEHFVSFIRLLPDHISRSTAESFGRRGTAALPQQADHEK